MTTINSLLASLALSIGLATTVSAQNDAGSGQSDEQLAQRFSQLDSNGDGVLSLEEFREIRGAGRAMSPPRGERMGQMTPEQREQMRERMQNMTPEQRERMREQMRERQGQGQGQDDPNGQAGAAHDHGQG